MQNNRCAVLVFIILMLSPFYQAQANITLLDKDEWKILFGGFIEADATNDSTSSFTEVSGNTAVAVPGTMAGDNGRTEFSIRNSRFAFTVLAPKQDDLNVKGYFEFDFLGYQAPVGSSLGNVSQSAYYSNPTLRVRHAYLSTDNGQSTWLAGQSWRMFGWNPNYVLTTVSVAPVAGTLYQRTQQISWILNKPSEESKMQYGVSLARPVQRDSGIPDLDAGVRYSGGSRRSGFASASGDVNAENSSLAITGTWRQFVAAGSSGTALSHLSGGAIALDGMLPVIASEDGKNMGGTLTLSAEYSTGTGYGDTLPGWSGNILQMPNGATAPTSTTNLDAGIGAYDSSGNLRLAQLQTLNVQTQYHFASGKAFMTAGYGQTYLLNSPQFIGLTTSTVYNRTENYFVNYFRDMTKQLRIALEYDSINTQYVAGASGLDNRLQASAWFRF